MNYNKENKYLEYIFVIEESIDRAGLKILLGMLLSYNRIAFVRGQCF